MCTSVYVKRALKALKNPFPARRAERLKMPMSEVVRTVSGKPIPAHVKTLVFEICCNDKDGEDVEVPYVKYALPV